MANNPLVIAIPKGSDPIVLDMAMTQYSFGRLAAYAREHRPLPVPGGFDEHGQLSTDAAALLRASRLLPIGYWKGSGLALALDLLAALLSRGNATFQLDATAETGISQVFMAFDVQRGSVGALPFDAGSFIEAVVADLHGSGEHGSAVLYPGERSAQVRADAVANGVPVDTTVWAEVCSLVNG